MACSWLVLVGSVKTCTLLPEKAAGFVWICLELFVRVSGYPEVGYIRISSGCPDIQSGYVRICLNMSIYKCSNTHYYGQTPTLKAPFCSNVRREALV